MSDSAFDKRPDSITSVGKHGVCAAEPDIRIRSRGGILPVQPREPQKKEYGEGKKSAIFQSESD